MMTKSLNSLTPLRLNLLLLAVLTTFATNRDSNAYNYFLLEGVPVVWSPAESLRYLSPSTFPPDSDPLVHVVEGMSLWNIVPGADFTYSYYPLSEDPPIDHYDGYNDTAAVSADSLDLGVLGVTYMVNNGAVWFDMDILFSDYPNGVGWIFDPNPDYLTITTASQTGFSFLLVATHELGHALGLGHDPLGTETPGTPFNIQTMNPRYPSGGPVSQSNIVEVHTPDRSGLRFLYPDVGTPDPALIDLANAGYTFSDTYVGRAVPVFFSPQAVSPGQDLTVRCVVENFGTTSEYAVRYGFYLSDDDNLTTADMLLADARFDVVFGNAMDFDAVITMPDLAVGSYYLGTILDDLDEITEEYEDNNQVLYFDQLVVQQLVPTIASLSQRVITCDQPFVGPTPQVDFPVNTAPIVWSLDNPQQGMVIDPATGVVTWPEPVKSPFEYQLDIRATNGAGSSTTTLVLAVHQAAPALHDIPDQTVYCGQSYVSTTPLLTAPACMGPITDWQLLAGEPGMTINPASGVVSWPEPIVAGEPYTVTIRAVNAIGECQDSWLVSVLPSQGDVDGDADIDLDDFTMFADCFDGPSVALTAGCECADLDGDSDVDLADYALLMDALGGVRQGACCFADSSCSDGDPSTCQLAGGTYLGDGTTCATSSCNGACCFQTGGCLEFSANNCAIAGGTFQGMDTGCGDLTCPPGGQGACCMPDESCTIATEATCAGAGGSYVGTGWSCEVADCEIPTGACCLPGGTCSQESQQDCLSYGGTYIGDDSSCGAETCNGACCYAAGGCLKLSESDCSVTGGMFQGAGTLCDAAACPIGACCYSDGSCTDGMEFSCDNAGGTYRGDDTSCATEDCSPPPNGACCYSNETCADVTELLCALGSGLYMGDNTACAEVSCSMAVGACCSTLDWTCDDVSEAQCALEAGVFEGEGTTCAEAACAEYRNTIDTITTMYSPGAGQELADDLTLSGEHRQLAYYELAVSGGGGGPFDVTVSLYTACPGLGGTLIPDTSATWTGIPDGDIYNLSANLEESLIVLPDTVWMVVTFSTDEAGWIQAEQAESGTTADVFGENDPPWGCSFAFSGSPAPYAGFWAVIDCVEAPPGVGACCQTDSSCIDLLEADCLAGGGSFQGDGTLCSLANCSPATHGACCNPADWTCTVTTETLCDAAAGLYEGNGTNCAQAFCPEYRNTVDVAESYYNAGAPLADDIALAGTDRHLVFYQIVVYGGGGGSFDVGAAFFDASPCEGGAQIPGTYASAAGLPDGEALFLSVELPAPVLLPDQTWLVVEFSTAEAGWIITEEAEAGITANSYSQYVYNDTSEQWEWACNLWFGEPPEPYAGFWAVAQCIDGAASRGASVFAKADVSVTPAGWVPGEPVIHSSTGAGQNTIIRSHEALLQPTLGPLPLLNRRVYWGQAMAPQRIQRCH